MFKHLMLNFLLRGKIMNNHLFLLAAAGLFLLAPASSVLGTNGSNLPPSAEAQGQMTIQQNQISDDDLEDIVEKVISSDKQLYNALDDFDVDVKQGVVTLTGKTKSQVIKSGVEAKIRALPGVKQVVNNIEIKDGNQQQPIQK
jgi:osmotically-inducible protein OsmY